MTDFTKSVIAEYKAEYEGRGVEKENEFTRKLATAFTAGVISEAEYKEVKAEIAREKQEKFIAETEAIMDKIIDMVIEENARRVMARIAKKDGFTATAIDD